jgi:[NiFe] hydrogenase large subunit/hydrogenase large subunit
MVMAHYLEALDWGRDVSRIHTLLGGKNPHPQTYLVGGMTLVPDWGGPIKALPGEHPSCRAGRPDRPERDGLAILNKLIVETRAFVDRVYVPDALAIAAYYDDWLRGRRRRRLPLVRRVPRVRRLPGERLLLPRGLGCAGRPGQVEVVDQAAIAETVARSWYTTDGGDDAFRHPVDGQTNQRYTGPKLPFTTLEGSTKYSWLKAPRYGEEPHEVGPLARMLVAYASGQADVKVAVDSYVARLGLGPEALSGTLGRMVARAIEAQVVANRLGGWLTELRESLGSGDVAVADITKWDPGSWPSAALGFSLGETPGGALGTGERQTGGRATGRRREHLEPLTARRQDLRGACEALIGTPVADPSRPFEILRTVHSFAPARPAVHAYGLQATGSLEVGSRLRSPMTALPIAR